MFQKCGTKARRRVVDITKVAATVGIDVCRALIGVHAYTGCDTVSAFAGKGKAKALKLLSKNKEIQDTFFKVENWKPTQASFMPPILHPLKSTISDTTCSVLRKVRLRVISFHHAGTAWKNMP